MNEANSDGIIDVAIAGGGISGLYSGWRILSETPGLNVQVFETGRRIGGRLLSLEPPKIPNARVEIGGMRFTDHHPWVMGLVRKLGLNFEPLPAGKPGNLAYLRGDRLQQSDLNDASKLPYRLRDDEKTPDVLNNLTATAAVRALKEAFQAVLGIDLTLEKLGQVTEEQWIKVGQEGSFEGVPLTDTPLRYLMLRTLSHEAFKLAEESSGYDSILYTWNGADGFPWNLADFGKGVTYHHVTDGYEQVPLQVANQFRQLGGQIHLRIALKSFREVVLADGSTGIAFETREQDGSVKTHLARKLILAMPRRSLELLDQTGPLLDPSQTEVRRLIESVTPIPLFKIALCYETPWWEKVVGPDSSGKSITDIPVRQCYYWKVNRENDHGVVLIYDDGLDLNYWANLRDLESPTNRENTFEHAAELVAYANDEQKIAEDDLGKWFDYPAPKRMVEEVHRQLIELHGANPAEVPQPYAAAYRDWGEDPYGGGANFWHVGVRSYEVEKAIIQPRSDIPVYICGECWSHGQGWVEGALATAEMMLQGHLQLEPPSWMNSGQSAE